LRSQAPVSALGKVLGGDRGYRPAAGPDARAAALAGREAAERAAHRILLEIEALRDQGVLSHAGLARGLAQRGIATPRGSAAWTHTTVARVLACSDQGRDTAANVLQHESPHRRSA
jgi:hypothetical protein